jgi:hypothetical protein
LPSSVDPAFASIIHKSLLKEANERYQTAEEMLDELREWLQENAGGDNDYFLQRTSQEMASSERSEKEDLPSTQRRDASEDFPEAQASLEFEELWPMADLQTLAEAMDATDAPNTPKEPKKEPQENSTQAEHATRRAQSQPGQAPPPIPESPPDPILSPTPPPEINVAATAFSPSEAVTRPPRNTSEASDTAALPPSAAEKMSSSPQHSDNHLHATKRANTVTNTVWVLIVLALLWTIYDSCAVNATEPEEAALQSEATRPVSP